MANNWTKEQEEAIYLRDCNLLVAAAAGSGKTAVLVERIIKIITDEKNPVDIDRLLVVTFTNAAAAEMRERIGLELGKLLNKSPNSSVLQRQLVLLNKAKITTIHSFCLDVIRNYFHLIDLDPKFRIADDTEGIILKNEILDKLFDEKYEEEDEEFLKLVEGYCSNRDDSNLMEIVLNLYNFSKSSPDPRRWLIDVSEDFNVKEDFIFGNSKWAKALLLNADIELIGIKRQMEKALKIIEKEETMNCYLENFQDDLMLVEDLLFAGKASFNNLVFTLREIQFSKLKRASKEANKESKEQLQKIRDSYKKQIKKLQEDILGAVSVDMLESLNKLYPMMKALTDLVILFDEKFSEEKRKRGMIDFNDFEHLTLKIVKEDGKPSKAALELREKYEYILIDEYQDSNLVQEEILTSISRLESNKPNIFMVGDVKQSIYRFRQAKPELFLEKYDNYSEKEGEKLRKILLFKNFRSRKNVIESVNFIFKAVMSKNIGELFYDENEELKLGAAYPLLDEKYTEGEVTELHIIERSKTSNTLEDEEEEDLDNIRLEGRMVAKRINELVSENSKALVFDKNINQYRKLQYKDIVILLRATQKWAVAFMEEFENFNIPVFADTGSGYFEATEIKIILALLQIIDNPIQDIPLLAVLRSPIGAFLEEEIIDIRCFKKNVTMYEALTFASSFSESSSEDLIWYEDNFIDKALAKKCNDFIVMLNNFRNLSLFMKTDEFIWFLYTETGYYGYAGAMPGGKQRQANLRILFQRAKVFENTSYKGLFNFISFIEKLKTSSKDMGSAKILGENQDVVRIMSIHKSKGLEFPVVFLSGTGKNFNLRDMNKAILFHTNLGLGPDFVDYDRRISYPTIFKNAIKNKIKLESLSEEMRILYVALTRAKEKLIITGSVKEIEKAIQKWAEDLQNKDEKISENIIIKGKNYLDWICPPIVKHEDGSVMLDKIDVINETPVKDESKWKVVFWKREEAEEKEKENISDISDDKQEILDNILSEVESNKPRTAYFDEIDRRLSWEYKYNYAEKLPSSITVTELKRQKNFEEEQNSSIFTPSLKKRPQFLEEEKGLTPAERGTAMHNVMQRLDFNKGLSYDAVQKQIQELVSRNLITLKQAEAVKINRIVDFYKSELGVRLLKSSNIQREIPFVVKMKAKEVYNDIEGDDFIMLQGAIDCYFEEEDGIVLIDYKTDYVNNEILGSVISKYKSQLNYYAKALKKITGKAIKEQYLYLFYNGAIIRAQ